MLLLKNKKKRMFQELGIIIALGIMVLFFTLMNPRFASLTNILNLGRQVSTIGIVAIGMTFLIIGGNLDLSVGSMFALVSTIVALLVADEVNILVALAAGILLGLIFGFINGILVTFCRLPSFVVGLGMLNVFRGAQLLLTGGFPILVNWDLGGFGMNFYSFLGSGRLFGIMPMMLINYLILTALASFILKRTKFGFWTTAVGASPHAAEIAGIRVKWVLAMGYVATGVLVAIASMLQLSFIGSVSGQVGLGYELEAIAAVIIGGTKLDGGEGTLVGTLIGAIIMGALRNGLVLLNVSAFWQTLIIGVVIIIAVAVDKWTIAE